MVAIHAAGIALASLEMGVFASVVGFFAGSYFVGGTDPVGGALAGGYGLLRVVAFLVGAAGALLVLLAANSLRQGHRRFLVLGGLVSLGLPFVMLTLDFFTFNWCTLWLLPVLTSIPAAVVLFEALPHAPPAPPREEW
jgi:hypothetical protein